MNPAPDAACVTSCGHCFHYRCIEKWLQRQLTCPVCRNQLDIAQCSNIEEVGSRQFIKGTSAAPVDLPHDFIMLVGRLGVMDLTIMLYSFTYTNFEESTLAFQCTKV